MHQDWSMTVRAIGAALILSACNRGPAAAPPELGGGGAITMWSDSTELFMEYPPLIVGQPDKFAVHLTDITDFAPLRSGPIHLTFTPREGGEPVVVTQDAPRSPGIYGPSPTFTRAGLHDLVIVVESPQARDTLRVPGLPVYESAAATPAPPAGGSAGIRFLKEQQWKTPGFATGFATRRSIAAAVAAPGEILPAAGRHAQVSAPLSGLIELAGIEAALAPGVRVRRGQRLAVITPSIGEGGSSLAAARRELREAEDEFNRAKRLYAAEAIPQRRLHEAETRLDAARETLGGLGGASATDEQGRLEIRAPLDGVIVEQNVVAGSRVEAGQHLLTVVDPAVVWLRVRVPAGQSASVHRTSGAWFQPEGSEQRFHTTRVLSVGTVLDSVSRTIPVLFEVRNADRVLTVGSLAEVEIETGTRATGVAIPLSAVLDEDGRPVAYVQVSGEEFEKRDLVLGGRDGTHALVMSGIAAGERVVSGAAVQVRLASLSTSVPAHGHEH
jgi:membrane fusion protein, heavy metal efflux system